MPSSLSSAISVASRGLAVLMIRSREFAGDKGRNLSAGEATPPVKSTDLLYELAFVKPLGNFLIGDSFLSSGRLSGLACLADEEVSMLMKVLRLTLGKCVMSLPIAACFMRTSDER